MGHRGFQLFLAILCALPLSAIAQNTEDGEVYCVKIDLGEFSFEFEDDYSSFSRQETPFDQLGYTVGVSKLEAEYFPEHPGLFDNIRPDHGYVCTYFEYSYDFIGDEPHFGTGLSWGFGEHQ